MPVVDRVNWLRGEIENGRHMHVSYGASSHPGILTIKVNLRPKQSGVSDSDLRKFYLVHVEAIWRLVTAHHSADRGHKLSDGASTVRFWITLSGNANLDNIRYDGYDPPPVPPPVAPLTDLGDQSAQGFDVAACDRDVSIDVIDTQNNAIFALSENVADKIDKLSLALAELRSDVNAQFMRSREQVVVGLDGLVNSLDEYIHQLIAGVAPQAVCMLDADPSIVAAMCMAVPIDVGSQCNLIGGATLDGSSQTVESYLALQSYMNIHASMSRVPADDSNSEDELEELDHNIVMLGGNLLLYDPLFGKIAEDLGEITGVYFVYDIEERLYEIDYGSRLYPSGLFEQSVFCDGVE